MMQRSKCPDSPSTRSARGSSTTEILVGNPNNRVDIVNLTTGVSANMGNWVMTHGFTAPLKRCECSRGFDFEYNLQVQRPF